MNPDLILSLYRTMVLIREFELKAREVFRTGRMPGFIHVYIGEEAVADRGLRAIEDRRLRRQHASRTWSCLG